MVADDFCNKGEAQAPAARFGGDEGIKDMRPHIFGYAGSGVVNADFKGSETRSPELDRKFYAGTEGRRQK